MTSAFAPAFAGFGTGLSLIVAIGAQNAFVLRQGIRRDAVLAVVGICALSDAVLIALGVGGVGAVVVAWPAALTVVGWIGGLFLLGYGALAAHRVVRTEGGRLAVYRDDDGALHAVSARCTHMGCLVDFNAAERAWECPCHGSRFDTEGNVVQGPATKPLERRDI
ncbi:LysE family transporter [Streptomyces cellulosae]